MREAATLAESGVPCALAVVAAATGSVPGKPGATMLVTLDGTSRGTVGGAGLEEKAKALCVEAIRAGVGGVHTFDLAGWKPAGLDSVCGGTVTLAIHLVRPAPHLLLLGAGHCAEALARVADVLRWSVTVVDGRPGFADEARFPQARACVAQDAAAFAREADLAPYSHAYVLGHSHHVDGDAVIALLSRGFAGHLGVIGSRSKLHAFHERAREAGIADDVWARVRSPIGLDVGAQTPAEIAVAVAAEIVQQLHPRPQSQPQPQPSRLIS
ncbi:MAG: xanthine dehydrogenase accessory factor [Thermoplasmata archaeon]|nr:xanthine dehydrogenase accessory factor [Thermoplasmata archaeon]